jgi:hypothetical protein
MEMLTHEKAVELIKSVKRKFAGQLELEVQEHQQHCALLWIKKKGYWNCQGHRRLWKEGVHLAFVYQDREYTAAKDFNLRYDDEKLLNPTIKEVHPDMTYAMFVDEYKEKLEHACQEAVKCNKILKMTDHERDFNIAMKLARENKYSGPTAEFMLISDEFYRRGEDCRLVALELYNGKVRLRRMSTKTILRQFTKEESNRILGAYHYRQSQLRVQAIPSK